MQSRWGYYQVKTLVQLAPGEYVEVENEIIESVNQQKRRNDLGLYTITENPSHRWLFRTPSLRNISLTACLTCTMEFLVILMK